MSDVNEFIFVSLLQDFIDENGLIVLDKMVNVKLPVVWEVGVFVRVNCASVVSDPNIVTFSCEDIREGFFSKVT